MNEELYSAVRFPFKWFWDFNLKIECFPSCYNENLTESQRLKNWMLLCTLCASSFKTGNLELTERWINLWLPSWLSLENMALKFAWQRVTETCNSQSVSSWWTLPISCSVSSAPWQYLIQLALCWLRWDGFQLHLRNRESNSSLPGPQQGSRQRHWNHLKQNPVKSLFPKWKTGKQQ